MLFLTLLTVQAQWNRTSREYLEEYCGAGGFERWESVDSDYWYWGDDWEEWLENGTSPFKDGTGEVYPAGFRPYELKIFNEPPICMLVPNSADYKIEVLMESPLENANLCIHDAAYDGVGNNRVGNVENCGSGKIYACFTAATASREDDFGFYVSCETGCEDMAVDVWIRVRVSPIKWDEGKKDTASDLEHWCEGEKGAHIDADDPTSAMYYTYPSDLIPDEPSKYPFHIHHIFGRNAGGVEHPALWTAPLAVMALLLLL